MVANVPNFDGGGLGETVLVGKVPLQRVGDVVTRVVSTRRRRGGGQETRWRRVQRTRKCVADRERSVVGIHVRRSGAVTLEELTKTSPERHIAVARRVPRYAESRSKQVII